jgi:hypothetical protein
MLRALMLLMAVLMPELAHALPLYTARSGRTCDNCHTDPTGWVDPKLSERKCSLSCQTCHTDPSGGGLRTVSGEFYGQATLPMYSPSHRGWEDWDRQPMWVDREEQRKNRVPDFAWRTPSGEALMAWDQERYAGLEADPMLSVGMDIRMAAWLAGDEHVSVFPMQVDTHVALHPVHHVTLAATAGVIAEYEGIAATLDRKTMVAPKTVYAMVHELPYMGYVRAGRFVPPFGTRTEDHTAFVRRAFELDGTKLESHVVGVEAGLAPNYPYAQVAVFRPGPVADAQSELDGSAPPVLGVPGWGAAVNAGFRELGWQLGGSALTRRRELGEGGDTDAVSLQGGFNPWFYWRPVPITLMGEYVVGRRQRVVSGAWQGHVAGMLEADLLVFNGLNLRAKVDWTDPDMAIAGDEIQRLGLGFDVHPLPNITVTGQSRVGVAGGEQGVDAIVFVHAWL